MSYTNDDFFPAVSNDPGRATAQGFDISIFKENWGNSIMYMDVPTPWFQSDPALNTSPALFLVWEPTNLSGIYSYDHFLFLEWTITCLMHRHSQAPPGI